VAPNDLRFNYPRTAGAFRILRPLSARGGRHRAELGPRHARQPHARVRLLPYPAGQRVRTQEAAINKGSAISASEAWLPGG